VDARRAFLSELIDDAGLFPPALLPMDAATAFHTRSREGPHGWMMGRFICPATALRDLLKVLPGDPARPWRVSVLLDAAGTEPWLERIIGDLLGARGFAEEAAGAATVELVETRLPPEPAVSEIRRFVGAVEDAGLPGPVTPYLEVPPDAVEDGVAAVAEIREETPGEGACRPPGAKIRCGGATEDLLPSPRRVATFVDACRRNGVPFKATAGLHHPFRHRDPATGFMQHGFVNLFGAAILAAVHDLDAPALEEILSDRDPSAFALEPGRFAWRDMEAAPAQVADARSALCTAYGSCSFDEPVEDLLALGVLPA
jgi:hypothetical protein